MSGLVVRAWKSYQATGSEPAYRAAALAFKFGHARTIKNCGGSACEGEWLDGLAMSLR